MIFVKLPLEIQENKFTSAHTQIITIMTNKRIFKYMQKHHGTGKRLSKASILQSGIKIVKSIKHITTRMHATSYNKVLNCSDCSLMLLNLNQLQIM